MYLVDYHIHTHNSFDGTSSLEEMVLSAAKKGINEICVTDHYECNRPSFIKKNTPALSMRRDFYNAVASNKTNVKMRFGVELGQPAGNTYQAQTVLSEGGFDFVIGSVHCVENGSVRLSGVNYNEPEQANKVICAYYDEILKIVKWGNFDVLAHFDVFRRYIARQGAVVDLSVYEGCVREIFTLLAKNNKGLEINTSSLYQPLGTTLPNINMLRLFKECGGEIITVGSDAHEMENVGRGIQKAYECARQAGFEKIALYEQRNVKFISL